MSTGTLDRRSTAVPAARAHTIAGRPAGRLLAGEWTKIRSLRSTPANLMAALLSMLAIGVLLTATADTGFFTSGEAPLGPAELSLQGYQVAQLILVAFGVLAVTGEYATGTVRLTFAATPTRWPAMLAKLAVVAAATLPTMAVGALTAFLIGQTFLDDAALSLTDPGVARTIAGTAIYLTAVTLIGSAIGWILRHTAGATTTALSILLLPPSLGALLPQSWGPDVIRWFPSEAVSPLLRIEPAPGTFTPTTGAIILIGWLAITTITAMILTRRRDV